MPSRRRLRAKARLRAGGSVWGEFWLWFLLALPIVLAVVGAYYLVAVWWSRLPTGTTAIERVFQPRLVNVVAEATLYGGEDIVFKVGAFNAGRGNIDGAMLNVLVPEFATRMERCTENGFVGLDEHKGGVSGTPEALISYRPTLGSIYWNGNLSFPGRMARVAYFRITKPGVPHDFPIRFKVIAPELDEPFDEVFCIRVSELTEPTELPPWPTPPATRLIALLESIDARLAAGGVHSTDDA